MDNEDREWEAGQEPREDLPDLRSQEEEEQRRWEEDHSDENTA